MTTTKINPYDLLRPVDVPENRCGLWSVERVTISKHASEMAAIQSMGGGFGRHPPPGTFTMLYRGRPGAGPNHRCLVMSDTPDERRDHIAPVREAKGHVLIAGLGIGMVLQAVLDHPDVERATVIEISDDLIELVGPHYWSRYGADRLDIVHADVRAWTPPRDVRYGAAWFDIWDNICSDNLEEMTRLKRRFARRADWMGCWSEGLCRRQRANDRRMGW